MTEETPARPLDRRNTSTRARSSRGKNGETTVLCAITSNLERAKAPGNLQLHKGEANLPRPSVVNVSQVITVDKSLLLEKIGTLSRQRVREIAAGLRLVFEPRELS